MLVERITSSTFEAAGKRRTRLNLWPTALIVILAILLLYSAAVVLGWLQHGFHLRGTVAMALAFIVYKIGARLLEEETELDSAFREYPEKVRGRGQ